jgi:hypothetical protein
VTARVDAVAGVVVDGDDVWPLRLDCRTGDAVLTLRGQDIAVMPMRWRHKQRLARWAHLGPRFVVDQRVALAVDPGTTLSEADRAIVDAVAAFLDSDTLPLEPGLLAAVTVEACRATGLAPAALDDRDAAEVEMIWRVSRAEPTPRASTPVTRGGPLAHQSSDPWADATSIVFEPPIDLPAPSPARHEIDESPHAPAAPRAQAAPTAISADGPSVVHAPAVEAVGRAGVDTPRVGDDHRPTPTPSVAPTSQRREAPRYRIAPASGRRPFMGGPIGVHDRQWLAAAPEVATPTPEVTTTTTVAAAPAERLSGPVSITTTAEGREWPATTQTVVHGRAEHGPVPAAQPYGHVAVVASAAAESDVELLASAVAERLAEQLLAAADDLGIEV